MVTKLEMGKKFIMDLIEQSVSAYEQRDELCNKLQNLEGKSQNEQNLHLQVRTSSQHQKHAHFWNKTNKKCLFVR